MPRPKLAVPLRIVLEAYQSSGSVRGAARELGVSRWAIVCRLREAGHDIRDRDEAMSAVRLLAPEPTRFRVTESVEWFGTEDGEGSTQVITRKFSPYVPCVWPRCTKERTESALCIDHAAFVVFHCGTSCAWPDCIQDVLSSDPLCYYHRGRAEGRVA
jgi:hypothetical protein